MQLDKFLYNIIYCTNVEVIDETPKFDYLGERTPKFSPTENCLLKKCRKNAY